jgi:predicted enzyme related to lactoylglutathione lyase
MGHVTGIGGIMFKARDPEALAAWYQKHFGFPTEPAGTIMFNWQADQALGRSGQTIWAPFPADSTYFAPHFMINYRVTDLDGLLADLRAAGVPVDDQIEAADFGRFAWATDPEGNRIELWEPAGEA